MNPRGSLLCYLPLDVTGGRAGKLQSEVIQPDRCVYWGLPTGLHQLAWYFSTLNQMNRSPVRQLDG